MGTNYYLEGQGCPTCKRPTGDRLHIGKSSAGWHFALQVLPDLGITDLQDWLLLLIAPDASIKDEYGKEVTLARMLEIILKRNHVEKFPKEATWRELNQAAIGRNGLACRRNCQQGHGTYDLVEGDFS